MAFFGISAHSATDEKTVKKNLDDIHTYYSAFGCLGLKIPHKMALAATE